MEPPSWVGGQGGMSLRETGANLRRDGGPHEHRKSGRSHRGL